MPIIVSKIIHPEPDERFYLKHIVHGTWTDDFDGFVLIVDKKD